MVRISKIDTEFKHLRNLFYMVWIAGLFVIIMKFIESIIPALLLSIIIIAIVYSVDDYLCYLITKDKKYLLSIINLK